MNKLSFFGFTLLEVLVALLILAISLTAAIKNTMETVENSRYLRDKTIAHWVAMNVLTNIQIHRQWPTIGRQKGEVDMANQTWHWQLLASETPEKHLRRVEIEVWNHQEKEPLTVLVGFIEQPES